MTADSQWPRWRCRGGGAGGLFGCTSIRVTSGCIGGLGANFTAIAGEVQGVGCSNELLPDPPTVKLQRSPNNLSEFEARNTQTSLQRAGSFGVL